MHGEMLHNWLAFLLNEAVVHDTDYEQREQDVYVILAQAKRAGWKVGFRIDPQEPEWPVAFVEIPGHGQVSWHMPQFPDPWDGHTTEEKFRRIHAFGEEGTAIKQARGEA